MHLNSDIFLESKPDFLDVKWINQKHLAAAVVLVSFLHHSTEKSKTLSLQQMVSILPTYHLHLNLQALCFLFLFVCLFVLKAGLIYIYLIHYSDIPMTEIENTTDRL